MNGLLKKYIIQRTDGKSIEDENFYFVLKLDGKGDQQHIDASRKAILTYADEIKNHLPELSKEIIKRYS